MRVVEYFRKEHNTIQVMTGVLGLICNHLEINDSLAVSRMKTALSLLKDFLLKNHTAKEDDIYFLAIEDPGMPKDIGPLYLMLEEHNLGRYHINTLEEQVHRYSIDDYKEAAEIVRNVRNYMSFLNFHHNKEETIIYPLIEKIVHQQKLAQVIGSYKEHVVDRRFYELLYDLNKTQLKKRRYS